MSVVRAEDMNRQFFFRHYWWIAIVGMACGIATVVYLTKSNHIPPIGSVVAAALAFCYFVQQQKLAETTLFKALFTEFNIRYDEKNDELLQIALNPHAVSSKDRQAIVDYFNLCGEEYLFYKEGYIHQDVWRAWCRGMRAYLDREPFLTVWLEEQVSDSYYGLNLAAIHKGAGKRLAAPK